MPVRKAGIDAAWVPTAGLRGHAVIAWPIHATHAIPRADARIPEARTTLDLVRLIQAIVGCRVRIPTGADQAGPRHSKRPYAPAVATADADPHLVKQECIAGSVGNVADSAAEVDRHDGPLAQTLVRRVIEAVVAGDVVVGVSGA